MLKITIYNPQPFLEKWELTCPTCGCTNPDVNSFDARCGYCKTLLPNPKFLIDHKISRVAYHCGKL